MGEQEPRLLTVSARCPSCGVGHLWTVMSDRPRFKELDEGSSQFECYCGVLLRTWTDAEMESLDLERRDG